MWNVIKLSADAASKMQINAGLLLKEFDISSPTEPSVEDIICDTTGDYSIVCTPETQDFFEDVNNAPKNTKEAKRITGWSCSLGITALSVTLDMLKLSLGAADAVDTTGMRPRSQYKAEDFTSLYWVGDMADENKLFVVVMDDTVSTGGLNFTATDNGKGRLALTLMPHATVDEPEKVPMSFYILEKVGA